MHEPLDKPSHLANLQSIQRKSDKDTSIEAKLAKSIKLLENMILC